MIITIDTDKQTLTVSGCKYFGELVEVLVEARYEEYDISFTESEIPLSKLLFKDISHT